VSGCVRAASGLHAVLVSGLQPSAVHAVDCALSVLFAGPWSAHEDATIIEAQARLGNRWIDLAALLPGRTANSIKNRWNATLLPRIRRQVTPLRRGGCPSFTHVASHPKSRKWNTQAPGVDLTHLQAQFPRHEVGLTESSAGKAQSDMAKDSLLASLSQQAPTQDPAQLLNLCVLSQLLSQQQQQRGASPSMKPVFQPQLNVMSPHLSSTGSETADRSSSGCQTPTSAAENALLAQLPSMRLPPTPVASLQLQPDLPAVTSALAAAAAALVAPQQHPDKMFTPPSPSDILSLLQAHHNQAQREQQEQTRMLSMMMQQPSAQATLAALLNALRA
jgi:hypothetical protein